MQEYLLVCLFPLTADTVKMQKQIAKIIGEFEGKVLLQENRDQDLVFPIKKQTQAILAKTFFTINADKVLKLTKDLDHESEILRFLLVKFPYTKVKLGNEAKVKRVKRQTDTKSDSKELKIIKKKVVKKAKKEEKGEELDKALAKILKE